MIMIDRSIKQYKNDDDNNDDHNSNTNDNSSNDNRNFKKIS